MGRLSEFKYRQIIKKLKRQVCLLPIRQACAPIARVSGLMRYGDNYYFSRRFSNYDIVWETLEN